MNMKRILAACAACALMLGGALAEGAEAPAPADTAAVEPEAVKGSRDVAWPEEYLITYEYQLPDGRVGQITQGRDAQGNVYFQSDGVETLFAVDGAHYRIYRPGAAGELVQQPDMYSEDYGRIRSPRWWNTPPGPASGIWTTRCMRARVRWPAGLARSTPMSAIF